MLIGFSGFEAPVLPGEGPELIAGRGSAWWSRGISTELGHAVVRHLFAHGDVESVHALVFSEINPAADRMMEKLGFAFVEEVPIHARLGPTYQRDTLRFELQRVLMARAGREAETLVLAAFKVGQLLGCRAAERETLLAEAVALAPEALVRAGWEQGEREPLAVEEYGALGSAWLDLALERRLRRLAATRTAGEADVTKAARELGRLVGAVARDVASAEDELCANAGRRGLGDVRPRVRAHLRAGLERPSMRLFRRRRNDAEPA